MNVKHTLKDIVLLIADGQPDSSGDIFDIETIKIPSHDVEVHMELGDNSIRTVGVATLRKEKNQVLADIELFKNLHSLPYYPCASGKILERDGKVIKGALINSIGFSISGNCDPRIKPIQLEKK